MRRGHRRAHVALVLGSAALGTFFLAAGWSARNERPAPQPFPAVAAVSAEPEWTLVLRTPQGPATASYFAADSGGRIRASLPPGLDAAEPGLILEAEGRADTLGSLSAARTTLPAPATLAPGRLVLADLARGVRLAEAPLPGSAS